MAAVEWNKMRAAEALLELGADPNHVVEDGATPLHVALRKRRKPELVRRLVDHGARGDVRDAAGVTPLDLPRRRRDPVLRTLAEEL